jgi:hypothetical protein
MNKSASPFKPRLSAVRRLYTLVRTWGIFNGLIVVGADKQESANLRRSIHDLNDQTMPIREIVLLDSQ